MSNKIETENFIFEINNNHGVVEICTRNGIYPTDEAGLLKAITELFNYIQELKRHTVPKEVFHNVQLQRGEIIEKYVKALERLEEYRHELSCAEDEIKLLNGEEVKPRGVTSFPSTSVTEYSAFTAPDNGVAISKNDKLQIIVNGETETKGENNE